MTEEKQIDEMACDMCTCILNCNEPYKPIPTCQAYKCAKIAVKKGYRKQSEGKWIKNIQQTSFLDPPFFDTFKCSLCGYEIDISESHHNFCPNCGAKMKGGAE